jgi:TrmH family RNA methyltransferase
VTVLESPRNPRVKAAAGLRDRRERERTDLTLVDGVRELTRALDAGVSIVEAFVDEDRVSVLTSTASVLDRLAFGDRSEGVVAVVRIPSTDLDAIALPEDPLLVVLEGLEKPGNVGAALRSADGAGADAVIAADPRTDLFNPNAIRASLGTIFTVPVAAAPSEDVRTWLTARGIRVVTAEVDAPHSYADADLTGPLAFVLGSEARGLTHRWRAESGDAVSLPMLGAADSLNVSVAAAVLLYEARRQRGLPERALSRSTRPP